MLVKLHGKKKKKIPKIFPENVSELINILKGRDVASSLRNF